MKKTGIILISIIIGTYFISCHNKKQETTTKSANHTMQMNDDRISLQLNPMQKQHQLKNMRSHLEAVQQIIVLLSNDEYDKASKIANTKLGSTTEMKMMCASFGEKGFENLGLAFHSSADEMSETFKSRDKAESLNALSNTIKLCTQCHATYRQ